MKHREPMDWRESIGMNRPIRRRGPRWVAWAITLPIVALLGLRLLGSIRPSTPRCDDPAVLSALTSRFRGVSEDSPEAFLALTENPSLALGNFIADQKVDHTPREIGRAASNAALRSDPGLAEQVSFPDPLSGEARRTSGLDLVTTVVPMVTKRLSELWTTRTALNTLSMYGSGWKVEIARLDDDQRRILAFLENSGVRKARERAQQIEDQIWTRFGIDRIRTRRILDSVRACDCEAHWKWSGGGGSPTIGAEGANFAYTARYDESGTLVIE